MAVIYHEKDADLSRLKGKLIGIIGFGSQGHAHAQNLTESGCQVMVGELPGSEPWKSAEAAGVKVATAAEVAKSANIIMMLVPDTVQARVYNEAIKPNLTAGKMLMFAHGFNIHYSQIVPPADVDVTMIAPKGPGHMVRQLYVEKIGIPALIAVHQDATGKAKDLALAYAAGMGSARAGVLETTFAEETETDLFGEQAVLCGGLSSLIKAGFETLVDAGYQPEIAYFECLHELKLIEVCYGPVLLDVGQAGLGVDKDDFAGLLAEGKDTAHLADGSSTEDGNFVVRVDGRVLDAVV